jgi:Zn-finger nucleic acid-binding protein
MIDPISLRDLHSALGAWNPDRDVDLSVDEQTAWVLDQTSAVPQSRRQWVDVAEFNRLMEGSFGNPSPNPGSARERTMDHAEAVGKIASRHARLGALRSELADLLGLKVDMSIVRRGGSFDQGPCLPVDGGSG